MVSGNRRGPLGGWEQLVTREGETVWVDERSGTLTVVVSAGNGRVLARETIPVPRGGYGGHELVLSAHERYLAMFLYSGQSEVGYELFAFRPELRHVHSFPYEYGEGLGPAISPDERLIGIAWATDPELTLCDLDGLEHEKDTPEEIIVDWAKLRVQELPNGPATLCNIELIVPGGFPTEGDDSYYPENLEFVGDHVQFRATWGEVVRVPLPLPMSITVPGPRSR